MGFDKIGTLCGFGKVESDMVKTEAVRIVSISLLLFSRYMLSVSMKPFGFRLTSNCILWRKLMDKEKKKIGNEEGKMGRES